MPRLPGPEALGNLPSLKPSAPAQMSGANPIAEGLGRVGAGMVALSNEQRERDEGLQLAEADAQLTTGLTDLRRRFETDSDWRTYEPRFQAEAARIRADAASRITSPSLMRRWTPRADVTVSGAMDTVLGRQGRLRGEEEFDRLDQTLSGLTSSYVTAADDDARAGIMRNIEDTIELGRRTGIVSADRLRDLRRRHLHGAFEADADARLMSGDGYAALLELREGDARATAPSSGEVSELGLSHIQRLTRPSGQTPQQAQADLRRLRTEAARISQWVGANVTGPDGQPMSLTQLQHDALVGFALSRRGGPGAKPEDTLAELVPSIQAGNWESVASAIRAGSLTALEQPAPRTAPGQPPGTAAPSADLGSISARYESGGRGVGMISSGRGDPGGQSYGIHQLSGASSMAAFLASPEGQAYRDEFGTTRPMTPEFNAIYTQIAGRDPEGFAAAQRAYYTRTHYEPARRAAESAGFDVSSRAIQEALFSIGVQHGGARSIIQDAARQVGPNASVEDQIRALYEARRTYRGVTSLPPETRDAVLSRYDREVEDVLALARGGAVPGAPPSAPGTPAPPPVADPRNEEFGDMVIGQAPASRYAQLPLDRRRGIIRRLTESLRPEVAAEIDRDIESIRQTGEPRQLPDGTTWISRAPRILTGMQAARIAQRVAEARAQFQAIYGLTDMTPADMSARLDQVDSVGDAEDGTTPRTRRFVAGVIRRITELRTRDPALWASGTFAVGQGSSQRVGEDGQIHTVPAEDDLRVQPATEVSRAYELLSRRRPDLQIQIRPDGSLAAAPAQGQLNPADARPQTLLLTDQRLSPEDRRLIIEARLAAMARVGIPEHDRRLLRADEAAALLGMPARASDMSDTELQRRLREAADRAAQLFGPQYARAAFNDAWHFRRLTGQNRDTAVGIGEALPMGMGEGITPNELSRLASLRGGGASQLDREEAMWRYGVPSQPVGTPFGPLMGVTAPPAPPSPGWFGSSPAPVPPVPPVGLRGWAEDQAGIVQPTLPTGAASARAQAWPRPSPEDIQALVSRPGARQERFDQVFGPGSAARYLQMQQGR